jgi:SAM-dependent methyltransferase
MVDLDTYRENSLATWDKMASGWEERREWILEDTRFIYDWLLDQAAPGPGDTVLEIASGTGDMSLMAAERAGSEGRVLVTDFSPEMVEAARRNGERAGVTNAEYRVLDAERMDLEDDSVDKVVSRWSYMLMADPGRALKETRRVLKDGGTNAFCVWQTPDRNLWAAIPGMTLVERGHMPPPEPGAPGIFAMGERDRVQELVSGAGFDEVRIEEIAFDWHYGDDDVEVMLTRIAGPIAEVLNRLPDDERQASIQAVKERMGEFRDDDGFTIPAATWGVVAR